MGRVVIPIITILLFHFSSRFSAETFSMTTNVFSSDEVDITAHSAIQPRNPYSLDYTRGNHTDSTSQESPGISDNSDTVTRMFDYLSNNSIRKNPDAIKVQTPSQNTQKIDESSHFNLEFRNCTNRHDRIHVTDSMTSVHWSFNPMGFNVFSRKAWFCDLELRVPQGMVAVVKVVKMYIDCDLDTITLLDDANVTLFTGCPDKLPSSFVTYSHLVTFHLTVAKTKFTRRYSFTMVMDITTLPESSRPQFELIFNSPTSGKVDMKNWRIYNPNPPFVKTSLHLLAPDDHILVVHFILRHYQCHGHNNLRDYVTFRTDNNTITYEFCNSSERMCSGLVFYSGWVDIEFRNFERHLDTVFTITFDFQHISQPPAALSGDRWRCSVTDWPEMLQGVPCIFMFDCYDKEAEGGCWQGDGTFKQGIFQVDGRCIALSHTDQRSAWNLESEWCQKRGGQLVSLSTSNMRSRLLSLLQRIILKTIGAIGLTTMSHVLSPMYKHSLQWLDKTVAHTKKTMYNSGEKQCFLMETDYHGNGYVFLTFLKKSCKIDLLITSHICQLSGAPRQQHAVQLPVIFTNKPSDRLLKAAYIRCPANHFTHVFLACDDVSACWYNESDVTPSCSAPLTPLPPSFKCGNADSVPYTLVCDHRPDCQDGSDEDFCIFALCDSPLAVLCSGRKCVEDRMVCNDQVDCDDYADEQLCHISYLQRSSFVHEILNSKSTKLNFQEGCLSLTDYMSEMSTFSCPLTHFMCSSLQRVCLPDFLRCNGLYDCPDHEDEAECDRYTCPGFYRCRQSQVCVHDSQVCDGVYHCPQRDDEILCNQTCPQSCVCYGLAFICSDIFRAADYSNLRYLDASGTLMTLADLWNNTFLVHLSLVYCNLTQLREVVLPNLLTLDLSYNKLTQISGKLFSGLRNIKVLKISNNPLTSFYLHNFSYTSPLKTLDMSHIRISEIDFAIISFFPTLTTLNLSGSQIKYVTGQGFPRMMNLRVLDLRQCPITHYPKGIFKALERLETVYADNYKLCCPVTLPKGFNVLNCHAPSDEVSSCDDLLRSNLYRVALATFASLSLLGNVGTLVYRFIFHKTTGNVGYDVFVSNLCVADFLMGVYLLIIGIADHKYRGSYVWEDVGWRNSNLCKVTGFVCLLSMEVSVLMIFLITVDRFMVLRFPFSSFHFRKRSAQLTCGVVWLAGLVLAVTPCLPMTSHWQFYSQTSICIPLPTSRVDFPGRKYSFFLIVVFNFICFLLIFVGQVLIYWSIHLSSMSVSSTSKAVHDITVARRLITVVMSDFLCWFPVGLTGILASYDISIAGEVNVAMAIFILPVNSALNPFLYTLNIYLERRRRAREEERQKRIMHQIKVANIVQIGNM